MPPKSPLPLPRPPSSYARVVRLGALEWVGIPLLALLPVLSLASLLGPSEGHLDGEAPGALAVNLTHPSRLRHQGTGELVVAVTNTGNQPTQDLVVALDEAYLSRFQRAEATPAPSAIVDGRVRVSLPPLAPGERASVRVHLEADDWGLLPGWVELGGAGQAAPTRLAFSTLVLP
jgi:hypothetical protein